ncbi:hypothetical protein DCCM_2338 [Desulfocucumis palustris]|uniref:Uncharacterized protein n=1 Tax=Desulfocucumis palustris TaxID=1898651 RepID=A0A2L2XAD8_9FIRM|nr:hypothetical protein DCCM_2338 [Desulfocucumis palustris]
MLNHVNTNYHQLQINLKGESLWGCRGSSGLKKYDYMSK